MSSPKVSVLGELREFCASENILTTFSYGFQENLAQFEKSFPASIQ